METANTTGDITDKFAGQFATGFTYGLFNVIPMPEDFRILGECMKFSDIKSGGGTAGLYIGAALGLGWYASVAISAWYGTALIFE